MKLLLISAMLCSGMHSIAASVPVFMVMDTSIDRSAYALSQDQFMEKYGRDDSSKALINFFFKRRSPGAGMIGGGLVLTAGGTVGLIAAVNGVNDRSNDLGQQLNDLWLAVLAGIALGAGVALAAVGIGLGSRYSKQRLLRLLDNYFTGIPIPRNIAKNIMFRGFVQYGEWDAETKKNIKSADRDRKRRSRN